MYKENNPTLVVELNKSAGDILVIQTAETGLYTDLLVCLKKYKTHNFK